MIPMIPIPIGTIRPIRPIRPIAPAQTAYLARTLANRAVDDIGCGHTRRLDHLENQIHHLDYRGLDKEPTQNPGTILADLSQQGCLQHLRYDVAFISWPINRKSIAWELFLPNYRDILYLGTNHSGTTCGDPALWKILRTREVLEVLPDPKETLIHYGSNPRPANAKTPREESLGIGVWQGAPIAPFTNQKYEPYQSYQQ